jgi:signal transduction histidine kinase
MIESSNGDAPAGSGAFGAPASLLQRSVLAGLQLAGWGLYGVAYYLTLRPHQPFADLLWKQTAIATGSGLLFSTLLGALFWTLRLRRRRPVIQALVLPAAGVATGLLWYQVKAWGVDWVDPFVAPVVGAAAVGPGEGSILSGIVAFPVVMLAWSGLYLGLVQWREQRRQERRVLEADAEAQRARLRMLRYQLNPHFFFNALNTIGALADERPEAVKTVVRKLSGFLRYTLLTDDLEAPLQEEVRAIEQYLAVEKVRFEDDLQVTVDVDPAAGRLPMPAFLVLPLVENAVKHGQRTSPSPLRIHVTGRCTDEGVLAVEVANTGHWRTDRDAPSGTDTGLDNVRARLRTRYPGHHRFTVTEDDGWVRARIEIDRTAIDAADRHA